MEELKYKITGTLVNGKRFAPIFTNTPHHYNIYKGTLWKKNGISWKRVRSYNN